MSTTTPSAFDPLSQSLDNLVRQGALSPDQASELYSAADARSPGGPTDSAPPSAGWSLPDRMRAGATTFGGALAFAALLTAFTLSASDSNDFKWSTFIVMAGITVAFAVGAAAWYTALAAVPHARWTASLLGTFGILGLGFIFLGFWGDKDAVLYLVGLGMAALGAGGYWFLRASAFTFAAFFGLVLVAHQFWDNVTGDGDGPLMYGVAMLFAGIIVGGAGWSFACRNVTGMLGGGLALWGFLFVVYAGGLIFAFGSAFGPSTTGVTGSSGAALFEYEDDIRVALILTLLLCAVFVALYAYTHFVGYLILSAIGLTLLPGVAILLLAMEHPLRWSTALFGGIGGLVLLAALVDQGRRSGYTLPTRTGGAPASGPPPPPQGGPPPPTGGPPPPSAGAPPPASQPPPPPPAGGTPPAPPSS